jgi:hypothetical protein
MITAFFQEKYENSIKITSMPFFRHASECLSASTTSTGSGFVSSSSRTATSVTTRTTIGRDVRLVLGFSIEISNSLKNETMNGTNPRSNCAAVMLLDDRLQIANHKFYFS